MRNSYLNFIAVNAGTLLLSVCGCFSFTSHPQQHVRQNVGGRQQLKWIQIADVSYHYKWCPFILPSGMLNAPLELETHSELLLLSDDNPQYSTTIDPILLNLLKSDDVRISDLHFQNGRMEYFNDNSLIQNGSRSSMMFVSDSINVWRDALVKGRVPCATDFENSIVWPTNFIFEYLIKAMNAMELPYFVAKHPEMVSSVLITMVRLVVEFQGTNTPNVVNETQLSSYSDNDDMNTPFDYNIEIEIRDDVSNESKEEDEEIIGNLIFDSFVEQWGDVIGNVHTMDQLFGRNHGLLDISDGDNGNDNGSGFGVGDGIWQHTGWKVLKDMQRQLESMKELRDLMKSIGRRPTSINSRNINKFPPRTRNTIGTDGAMFDTSLKNTGTGLTQSSSLSDMLPSEAVLLRGSSKLQRLLFMAKRVESKLLSYELSAWTDVPSLPKSPKKLERIRMPSGPGGPLILCLDTSWSMSGMKETLSKAVVLSCAVTAYNQGREFRIASFSSANNVMEISNLSIDAKGISHLLDFLSFSFVGGGTDVTGALKYAIESIPSDGMTAADILLVTDGEIPDPPVSEKVMNELLHLRQFHGVQVHGLLVGRNESKPLSKLCTNVHDFLAAYEKKWLTTTSPESGWGLSNESRRRNTDHTLSLTTSLFFKRFSKQKSYKCRQQSPIHFTRKRVFLGSRMTMMTLRASFEGDDYISNGRTIRDNKDEKDQTSKLFTTVFPKTSFNEKIEISMSRIREEAVNYIQDNSWQESTLETERATAGSCWKYHSNLRAAIDMIASNLVERDEESKIVVLGMLSNEHVLLVGPPGTAKSALGRRLSILCGGTFFQRLLTKFTTPEEIFGPLSLRALENDEYKRCTEGYLPTASVAFLDEIFKANSAILNTLLTILNERKFDNGIGDRQNCPIKCVVGASNEMPESDELDALYDRFLLRKEVKALSDDGLIRMLSKSSENESNDSCFSTGDFDEMITSFHTAIDSIKMESDVCFLIRDLRNFMKESLGVNVSDRRLSKAARLLKISAASQGRTKVDFIDCLLLQHIVWRLPEQRQDVRDWLLENLTPGGGSSFAALDPFRVVLESLRQEVSSALRKTSGDISGAYGARVDDINLISALRVEVVKISKILEGRLLALSRHEELIKQSLDYLWLDPDEARAVQQLLLPRAKNVAKATKDCFMEALMLQSILTDETIDASVRPDLVDLISDGTSTPEMSFDEEELAIGMKEAKARYNSEQFRAWKRAKKKQKPNRFEKD